MIIYTLDVGGHHLILIPTDCSVLRTPTIHPPMSELMWV